MPRYALAACTFAALTIAPTFVSAEQAGPLAALEERGIDLGLRLTQTLQGITSGGLKRHWETGGSAEFSAVIDLDKALGWEGASFYFMAEDIWGKSVNQSTGMLTGSNLDSLLPVVNDRSAGFTRGYLLQAFSPQFGVYLGRIDTFEGDKNVFAHGRGETQFINPSLTFNPVTSALTPYSAWGAGAYYVTTGGTVGTLTVMDSNGRADRLGFDDAFEDGVTVVTEWRMPVTFLGLPGHQFIGANYTTDNITSISSDPVFNFGGLDPISKESDGWALRWNFDQVIWQDDSNQGRQIGLFGRAGLADDSMNAAENFVSFGATIRDPFDRQSKDELAAGIFRIGLSDEINDPFSIAGAETGIEAYYKLSLTDNVHLTADVQHVQSAVRSIDNATVLGFRMGAEF